MDKQGLLNKIQHEQALWEAFLVEVGEERMEEPGATDDWTFKDVVAHLSAWRARTLVRLEAAHHGKTPPPYAWPLEWGFDTDEVEESNRRIYARNRERTLTDVLEESRQQFRQLEHLVKALSEEDLFNPHRFEWMEGEPLASLVGFTHFHEEHEPQLRAWLERT